LGRDIVVRSVEPKYFVRKPGEVIRCVVIRKWRSRNPNLYPRLIDIFSISLYNGSNGDTSLWGEINIKKRVFDLEKEALLASGIQKKDEIAFSINKLDHLYQQFICHIVPPSEPVEKARLLFTWLWKEKPARYKPQGNYKLSEVIDAQMSDDAKTVGNCLGLTLLYNCLLRRMGIMAEALYLENGFGIGPHVLTLLQTEDFLIDIENILRDGFDYKGHLHDPSRIRWGDKELIADIYHSMGNEFFSKGEFIEALENYDRAINLNPQYGKAHINRAILLDKMEEERRAGRILE